MKYVKWYLYYEAAVTAYNIARAQFAPKLPVLPLPSVGVGILNNFTSLVTPKG